MKVGFIGVGNMGGPMCRNPHQEQRARDPRPRPWTRRRRPAAAPMSGGTGVGSIAEAAGESDVVFTSLPMPSRDVEAVALGEGGDRGRAAPPGHGPCRPQHQLADHGA